MITYALFGNGSSGNHGCEAINRSTIKILGLEDTLTYFSTRNYPDEVKYGLVSDKHPFVDYKSYKTYNKLDKLCMNVYHIITKKDKYIGRYNYKMFNKPFANADIALSVGGDNYCYGAGEWLCLLHEKAKAKGAKTVLWGCSVDSEFINESNKKNLNQYDLIIARETLTYDLLKQFNDNVVLYPDPAFQLDKVELPLPKGFAPNNTVGINISPMIMENEKHTGMAFSNYKSLIEHIINTTDMQIALIPHVVWDSSDDRKPLTELYKLFKDTGRVVMIGDHNCMELKGYISRCRFFVGARTHATIAAYSTCVPTLVVGYSVKAKGIAKDLFGTYDNYVVPVQSLTQDDTLSKTFDYIYENENIIRTRLESIMPEYCNRALDASTAVKSLVR
ncbi:MAG TPA: polysaccharide pyruvyl transferase family protein [Clostridiales bacterium]|nr:polysaccharide pyruvyl transferase family protein [Clostridiales bacterium]